MALPAIDSAFHLSVTACSRSHGHSAAAKVAYDTADRIVDCYTGRAHNYQRRRGVLRSACVNFSGTPRELAQLMDQAEKRQNSTVCREAIVALPHGLPLAARWKLLQQHAEAIAARWGVPVALALHVPSAEGDQRNDHGHLVFATRKIARGVLTEKTRVLDEHRTGREEIKWLRAKSATLIGAALDAAGRGDEKARFDHRSYADRGIERPTTRHEGPRGRALARKNRASRLSQDNRALRAMLAEQTQIESEIRNERRNEPVEKTARHRAGRTGDAGARIGEAEGQRPVDRGRGRVDPVHGDQIDPPGPGGGHPPRPDRRPRALDQCHLGAGLGRLALGTLSAPGVATPGPGVTPSGPGV